MITNRFQNIVEVLILAIMAVLANYRALFFSDLHLVPMAFQNWDLWRELLGWLLICLLAFWILSHEGSLRTYLDHFKNNWLLIVFVCFASLSIFWTIYPIATIYQLAVLIFATMIAGYVGVRYNISQFINILAWIGCIFTIASFLIILIEPGTGMMMFRPYNGAWRGIFWHRNHLGSLMALFNAVLLFKIVEKIKNRHFGQLFIFILFYGFTLLLVKMSASATGLIIVFILNLAFFSGLAWINWGARLRPIHYYMLAGVSLVTSVALILNLDYILGFVNRNSSLTGRVPLWSYLIRLVISQRPLIGYGFGAIWNISTFRNGMADLLHWSYAVQIGDNGFVDILLHLGIVGLLLFVALIIVGVIRALKYFINTRSLIGMFPLLIMGYVVVANITFSLFIETESFVWMIVVVLLFFTTANKASMT
jgi:exopolysaccharide production protein ExoQ